MTPLPDERGRAVAPSAGALVPRARRGSRIRSLWTAGDAARRYAFADRDSPGYQWWKPLLVLVSVAAVYCAAVIGIALVVVLGGVILSAVLSAAGGQQLGASAIASVFRPEGHRSPELDIVIGLGPAALLLPVLAVALKIARRPGLRLYSSVAGRIRWRWLCWSLLPALCYPLVLYGAGQVVSALRGSEDGVVGSPSPVAAPGTLVISLILLIALGPLQCAAEEYFFRGWALQAFAAWTRSPFAGAALAAILFASGHSYNIWGRLDVLFFALATSFVTLRTGGLEAGILLHIAVNFPIGVTGALAVESSTGDRGRPLDLLVSSLALLAWMLAVVLLQARRGARAGVSAAGYPG